MSFVSLQRPKSKYPNEWIVCCGPQSPNEFRYIFAVEEEAEAEDKGEERRSANLVVGGNLEEGGRSGGEE